MKNGINYRKGKRQETFAHTSYQIFTESLLNNEPFFREQIIHMIKDVSFLIKHIDDALIKFKQN